MKFIITILIYIFCLEILTCQLNPTPTLKISLVQAQQLLIQNNLELISSKYNISIAEAQLLQARQWRNPLFVWNSDLYSVELNQYLNFNNQRLIQVEQVISISGKHRNEVKLAKKNVELNILEVEDVMRSLLYECALQYLKLQEIQNQMILYNLALNQFDSLENEMEIQLKKGNIAGIELTRIRSELLDLKSNLNEYKLNEIETNTTLNVLLALPQHTIIETSALELPKVEFSDLQSLVQIAKENRADYRLKKAAIAYEDQNLKLQRSYAIPDINFGYQPHDKGSNYVRPYSGIVVEFSVPLFDRNQGGIQEAKINIKKAENNLIALENQILHEVHESFQIYKLQQKSLQNFSEEVESELDSFRDNSIKSFSKRLINMIEYIDQQRIYLSTKNNQIQIKALFIKSLVDLQFRTGQKILN